MQFSGNVPIKKSKKQFGFTIIELIMVIALIGLLFVMAAPNLSILSSTEAAQKIGTLAADIRGAYDMAVLHRRPHRLVFQLATGQYWLETTDQQNFRLAANAQGYDLSSEQVKEEQALFDEKFEEYKEKAGREVQLPDKDEVITPTSPLINAQSKLRPSKWRRIEDSEWGRRSIGPQFSIGGIQAEHHDSLISFTEVDEDSVAHIYFFPQGYVERAVIYVTPAGMDMESALDKAYTIVTRPFEGVADVSSGYQEVDIFDD
jgi:general secretion pathway protein H